jgi:DNA integrity scanning protein DisA with diadenylate cyclase activity
MNIIREDASFKSKALGALGIAVTADALDYFAAPIFSTPIIGDIFDSFITGLLYSITKSKLSTAVNMAEFIPFIGDFLPVYTLSTLMWISKESKRRNKERVKKYEQEYHNKTKTPVLRAKLLSSSPPSLYTPLWKNIKLFQFLLRDVVGR